MATLTISIAGSAVVTGSKTYTVSDADITSLLAWAQVAFNPYIQATYNPTNTQGFTPTPQQVLLAWVQSWINGTKNGVQQANTPLPTPPPQISLT